jgi:hypothetical protein
MRATDRSTRRWVALLVSAVTRRRVAFAVSPALAFLGLLATPATPVQAAYTCSYSDNDSFTKTVDYSGHGGLVTLHGEGFAGYYSGDTIVPSTTGVSDAGIEAQCLVKLAGFDPGTIDGVFGRNSQSAMKAFQEYVNSVGAGLQVDGLPGPDSWPWLRCVAQDGGCQLTYP